MRVYGGEASYQQYWFGTVRFIHFVTAYVFIFNFVFRLYWSFVGNRYASWKNFLPLRKHQWRELFQVLRFDIFLGHGSIRSIGHNALASFTYLLTFLAFLLQSATGFGMYAAMSDAALPRMFAWVVPMMGGDSAVRQWHYAATWFFILFAMVHVYLAFYHDYVERRGIVSSMVGGWKFVRRATIAAMLDREKR